MVLAELGQPCSFVARGPPGPTVFSLWEKEGDCSDCLLGQSFWKQGSVCLLVHLGFFDYEILTLGWYVLVLLLLQVTDMMENQEYCIVID